MLKEGVIWILSHKNLFPAYKKINCDLIFEPHPILVRHMMWSTNAFNFKLNNIKNFIQKVHKREIFEKNKIAKTCHAEYLFLLPYGISQ